jgi:molecular chaperone GrpE
MINTDPQTGNPTNATARGEPAGDASPAEPSAVGPGAGEPDGSPALSPEETTQLRAERDEFKEQLLRTRADFANFQKRAKQQAETDRAYAIGNLARDLLEAIDNLERATAALRASANEGITSGLDMVQKQMLATLAKYGVEPIEALGRPFDPNLHEALMQQPTANHPEGSVVAELSKGYKIHDRVLRPSKVAVSTKPEPSDNRVRERH